MGTGPVDMEWMSVKGRGHVKASGGSEPRGMEAKKSGAVRWLSQSGWATV